MKPPAHKHAPAESSSAQGDMQLYRLTGTLKVNTQQLIQLVDSKYIFLRM